jgi:hypothetical protein
MTKTVKLKLWYNVSFSTVVSFIFVNHFEIWNPDLDPVDSIGTLQDFYTLFCLFQNLLHHIMSGQEYGIQAGDLASTLFQSFTRIVDSKFRIFHHWVYF